MAQIRLFVMGAPRLERNGRTVALGRRKAFALLVYLAITGEPHRRDTLATLFWPEADQVRARAALRRTLASIKAELGDTIIVAQREWIGLSQDPRRALWTDAVRMRVLLDACRAHGLPLDQRDTTGPDRLVEAVAFYRGPFLAGFTLRDSPAFDDWQLWQAETLQREQAEALQRLINAFVEREAYEPAIPYNRQWLLLDPLDETACRSLMSLLSWSGQRQAALRQYDLLCHQLERELGLAPQRETVALYQAICDGAALPTEMAPGGALAATGGRASPILSHLVSKGIARRSALGTLRESIGRARLVGRERQLEQMLGHWKRAESGEGKVLLLEGAAGIGKTRLGRELATLVEGNGANVLIGRCQSEGDPPFGPIAQILRNGAERSLIDMGDVPAHVPADLLMLAPHLRSRFSRVDPGIPLGKVYQRQRMFESFAEWCAALAVAAPLLIWIEDVHWADEDTLYLLRHLAYQLGSMPLLLLITYRDTELVSAGQERLTEFVLSVHRARISDTITLSPLTREQTREQLAALLGIDDEISLEFLESIHGECGGNPFYVEEVCRSLVEQGKLYRVGNQWRRVDIDEIVIPSSVRAAILSRVVRLPASVQEVLSMAAVIGQDFDLQLLSESGDWEEESLAEQLDYARRFRLVEETSRPGGLQFSFTHSLIPFAIREHLGALRLRKLHLRVAGALERYGSEQLESLAHHFAAGGETSRATTYLLLAADQAAASYAHENASRHLRTALRYMEESGLADLRLPTLEKLADIERLRGAGVEAIQLLQDALNESGMVAEVDPLREIRLRRKFGEAVFGTEWIADTKPYVAAARNAINEGLRLTSDQPVHAERVRLLICRSQLSWRHEKEQDWDAAERDARAAVAAAEILGRPVELSVALGSLAVVMAARGQFLERAALVQRRLEVSQHAEFDDAWERAHLLNEMGAALCDIGRFAEAMAYHEQAEQLAIRVRSLEEALNALKSQALCAYRLDLWDDVLMDEKLARLRRVFQNGTIAPVCMHQALQAAVLARRGHLEQARSTGDASMAQMIAAEAPERWGRPSHY